MQDGMERKSIKITFNKILVVNKVHGEVIDSKLILSQNVRSIVQVWKLITSYV